MASTAQKTIPTTSGAASSKKASSLAPRDAGAGAKTVETWRQELERQPTTEQLQEAVAWARNQPNGTCAVGCGAHNAAGLFGTDDTTEDSPLALFGIALHDLGCGHVVCLPCLRNLWKIDDAARKVPGDAADSQRLLAGVCCPMCRHLQLLPVVGALTDLQNQDLIRQAKQASKSRAAAAAARSGRPVGGSSGGSSRSEQRPDPRHHPYARPTLQHEMEQRIRAQQQSLIQTTTGSTTIITSSINPRWRLIVGTANTHRRVEDIANENDDSDPDLTYALMLSRTVQ